MGVLADLVPLSRSKAELLLRTDAPYERFGGRDVKGLGIVALEQLAVHCGAPEADALTALAHDDSRAVLMVHPTLVDAAAGWEAETLDALVLWWSSLEELGGMPEDFLAEYLESLRWVAREAKSRKLDVLYWTAI